MLHLIVKVQQETSNPTQQRRPIHSRDLLWINVNGIVILNAYRQPLSSEVIDYITHLTPSSNCLIGGDYNTWHDMFEPGVQTAHRWAELAHWSSESGMNFIGTPGEPTQRAGYILDLTFSNIPFTQSIVRPDMHSGSDHETQVTSIPGRRKVPLEQFYYRIPEADLPKFAGLVKNGIAGLSDPWLIPDAEQALRSSAQGSGHQVSLIEEKVAQPHGGHQSARMPMNHIWYLGTPTWTMGLCWKPRSFTILSGEPNGTTGNILLTELVMSNRCTK